MSSSLTFNACRPNYCCIQGPSGEPGPQGPSGDQGPQGPSGEAIWFDNFTFGLSFPMWSDGVSDTVPCAVPSDEDEYWLVPGMETIWPNLKITGSAGGWAFQIPNTLDSYKVGGINPIGGGSNVPRSMAIAYNDIILDGVAVHLTEIGTTTLGSIPQVISNGWSADVTISIYIFCKVDTRGRPVDPVVLHRVNYPMTGTPNEKSGGYCDCSGITPLNVGCDVSREHKFIAISFKSPPPPPSGYRIQARTISVTLHGQQTDSSKMEI